MNVAAPAMTAPVRAGRALLHLPRTMLTCVRFSGCSKSSVSSLGILCGLNMSQAFYKPASKEAYIHTCHTQNW